jgi:hypothetical protein
MQGLRLLIKTIHLIIISLLIIIIIDAGKPELESGKFSTPIASENVHAPFGEGDNCCCILSLISGGIISWISECGQFTIDYQRVYCFC